MLDLGPISINRVGKYYDINVIKADTNIRESSLVSRYTLTRLFDIEVD